MVCPEQGEPLATIISCVDCLKFKRRMSTRSTFHCGLKCAAGFAQYLSVIGYKSYSSSAVYSQLVSKSPRPKANLTLSPIVNTNPNPNKFSVSHKFV